MKMSLEQLAARLTELICGGVKYVCLGFVADGQLVLSWKFPQKAAESLIVELDAELVK